MQAPEFWYRQQGSAVAIALAPLAWVYARAARARYRSVRPWRAPIPVLCVGNLVVGGAGKTPLALNIARRLAARGIDVHFLSRGYGGRAAGPVRVDPRRHGVTDVGDEPLLLARLRPTWVSRDRAAGIRAAVEAGAELVVMDDGFQNPGVVKDLALIAVDGVRGFGNGRVIPAGPLREPIEEGLKRADAVVIVGPDETRLAERLGGVPVLRAHLCPSRRAERLSGRNVVAFAGIGNPDRFFNTLRDLGCVVVGTHPFPDHYRYNAKEINAMIGEARAAGAALATTAKDAVRLPRELRDAVEVVTVRVRWEDGRALDRLLEGAVHRGQ